jgi:hypothetical protein
LSTVANSKFGNTPWLNIESAGWLTIKSALTVLGLEAFSTDLLEATEVFICDIVFLETEDLRCNSKDGGLGCPVFPTNDGDVIAELNFYIVESSEFFYGYFLS